jgi:MFS family permease
MTLTMISNILSGLNVTYEQNFIIWAAYYITSIVSGIVGSILSKRIGRLRFLCLWIVAGIVTSSLPALLNNFTLTHLLIFSMFSGISFGLGMPSCLAYFAESTIVENRGRIGGITLLLTNLSAPLLAIPFQTFAMPVNSIIMTLWRGMGLIIFFLKIEESSASKITNTSFISILREKSFYLYFISWFMFCLVDKFEKTILIQFLNNSMPSVLNIMYVVEPIIGSIFMLIAGLLCDLYGRKRTALYGFVALGLAYAIIGLAPGIAVSWYFYFLIDGIAWGTFFVIFILILWGDISRSGSREKYYTLGSIPFFLSSVMPLLLDPSSIELISPYTAFSLASFFLFVAVMPLVFAPETLPEKKMELRRLRSFAEDAKKAKEKYESKVKG